jgi:aldose 1-epimerase
MHIIEEDGSPAVRFTYLSKDGEQGYSGNLSVNVTYTLTNNNELKISYSAFSGFAQQTAVSASNS